MDVDCVRVLAKKSKITLSGSYSSLSGYKIFFLNNRCDFFSRQNPIVDIEMIRDFFLYCFNPLARREVKILNL